MRKTSTDRIPESEEGQSMASPQGRGRDSAAKEGTLIRGHGRAHFVRLAREAEEKALRAIASWRREKSDGD